MPLVANILATTARLKFQTGIDAQGKPVYKNRSYGHVKPHAADQAVYDTCRVIAGLQKNTLVSISKIVETELVESL